MNPLDAVVSLWPSAFARADQTPDKNLTLADLVRGIRNGSRRGDIERLRELFKSDPDAYQKAKRSLPAFAASGRFSGRSAKALLDHSGCILLDYDHIEDLAGLRARACSDPHVLLCFLSPSGDGLKIGVRVPPCADADAHKHAWSVVAAYAAVWGGNAKTDEVCKDVSRLCFVSYDPDAYANPDADALAIPEPEPRAAPKPRRENGELDAAVAKFNSDHAQDWGAPGQGACPVCQKAGRFGNAGGPMSGSGRWACWGQTHFQHKVGINAGSYHHGDALDIQAFRAGVDRIEHLRASGYLAERKKKSADVIVASGDDDSDPDGAHTSGNTVIGSDLWFARRIAAEHGRNLKYVWEWKSWVAWQPAQGRWARSSAAAAWSAGKTTAQRLLTEAQSLSGIDEGRMKVLLKAAGRFMGKKGLDAGLALAQSEAAVIAGHEDFDSHPYLLNCANGTVDLRTGELRPHSREDMLTKVAACAYDPDMPTPLWDGFLARILPDAEVLDYMHTALGYSVIGNVLEHVIHVAWGGGANGKGVLFGTCSGAVGEYAADIPPAILVQTGRAEHPTLLTILKGARLAVASETPQRGRFDEAQLKKLTGGDTISARGMYENYYHFRPTHTLWLQTNHKPKVRETTFAFWRRLRLVPFTVSIPVPEQDRGLPEKLKAEWPGVLAWLVKGAVQYHKNGLNPPASVVAATQEYEASQDDLREFVEMYKMEGFTSSKDIYEHYLSWAMEQGMKPWGRRTLTAELRDERKWTYSTNPRGFRVSRVPEGEFRNSAPTLSFIGKSSNDAFQTRATPKSNPATTYDPAFGDSNAESDIGDDVDRWIEDGNV